MQAEWALLLLAIPIAASVAAWNLADGPVRKRIQWAVFGLIFPPSVLWFASWRLRGSEPIVEVPRGVPVAVVAPGLDESLEFVPEPTTACPDCGYLGIRPPGIQDGVYPGGGELILYVCPRCHYRGLPLRFQRREDYADFLRELARS